MCGILPKYFRESISNCFTSRPLKYSNKNLVAKPKIRSKVYGEWTFIFAPPSVWNSLSKEVIKELTRLTSLRKLKTQLFETVFKMEEV